MVGEREPVAHLPRRRTRRGRRGVAERHGPAVGDVHPHGATSARRARPRRQHVGGGDGAVARAELPQHRSPLVEALELRGDRAPVGRLRDAVVEVVRVAVARQCELVPPVRRGDDDVAALVEGDARGASGRSGQQGGAAPPWRDWFGFACEPPPCWTPTRRGNPRPSPEPPAARRPAPPTAARRGTRARTGSSPAARPARRRSPATAGGNALRT